MAAVLLAALGARAGKAVTDYVNPLRGTTTLWDPKDIGYTPTHRTWGAEVFPGAALPNAMVQLTPVTRFHSGSGYEYEDPEIYGFAHTSKGHWNLCHIPLLPATGDFSLTNYASPYSHSNESAHPGYYQVYLERYGVNAELTSTLRCAFHKYTFQPGAAKKLIANLTMSNERVRRWEIHQEGDNVFTGFQQNSEKMYFYAESNIKITGLETLRNEGASREEGRGRGEGGPRELWVVRFADAPGPLELRIGFSFVSVENAKANFEKEIAGKSFDEVRREASEAWEALLSKVKVTGGTERQRSIFYSCLYRAFLWPDLRSDVNGDFFDQSHKVVNKGFRYYTLPSLWDTYRNKLVLLTMFRPKVSADVIQSMIDMGEKTGFMPTFFHGDHAAAYIAGAYARGLRGFDVQSAYRLLLRNATVEGGTRPYIGEYMTNGYVSDKPVEHPNVETHGKAGVTKTLEYAYDDYAVAQLAKALGDTNNYRMLMARTKNYTNVFDPSTEFMRGRTANGEWIKPFDPEYPHYEYMYREANAWESTFFAPQDMPGLIGLFKSKEDFERKLDDLFSIPWDGVEAYNLSGFIGQYCQGNQPDHSDAFLYYFVGKQEKSQALLNRIMDHFYDMGKEHLAYAGMDDAGEMSSWYVCCAMGLYPFSPADEDYIISVPLFDSVTLDLDGGAEFTIKRVGDGEKISQITYDNKKIDGYFVSYHEMERGKTLVVTTE